MELNGRDDYFARWLHAICAIPLLLFIFFDFWAVWTAGVYGVFFATRCGGGGIAFYLTYRLLKYAVTGKDNINRDDY
jgi:hypothetical protein